MESAALKEHLEAEPFRRFEVIGSSGDRYEVRSPDSAWLLPTRLFVAMPPRAGDEIDRVVSLSLPHIAAVEEMQESGR